MTLKSITLHRAATDNLGNFQDAGSDLVVGDAVEAGTIDAARAHELVSSHGAQAHRVSEDEKPAKKAG